MWKVGIAGGRVRVVVMWGGRGVAEGVVGLKGGEQGTMQATLRGVAFSPTPPGLLGLLGNLFRGKERKR